MGAFSVAVFQIRQVATLTGVEMCRGFPPRQDRAYVRGTVQKTRPVRLCIRHHNHMALKRTTVMVDEADLQAVKQAAARQGRPESEVIREAFRLVALKSQQWGEDWDIPNVDFGYEVTAADIDQAVRQGTVDR